MRKVILKNEDVLYPELSYKIYGLCFEAQNTIGRYLNEKQFCDFMETLFKREKMKYDREKPLPKSFEGEKFNRNIPDFILEDLIVFDAKAKRYITRQNYYQMQRYLNSYNKKLGIIVNFREHRITPRRVINPNYKEIESVKVVLRQSEDNLKSKIRKIAKYS